MTTMDSFEHESFDQLGQLFYLASQNPKAQQLTIGDFAAVTKIAVYHGLFKIFMVDGKPKGYVIWGYFVASVLNDIRFKSYRPHDSEWVEGSYPAVYDAYSDADIEPIDFEAFVRRAVPDLADSSFLGV